MQKKTTKHKIKYKKVVAQYHAKQAKILKDKLEQQQKDWKSAERIEHKKALKTLKEDDRKIRDLIQRIEEEGFKDKETHALVEATRHMIKKANDWAKNPTGAEGPEVFILALTIAIAALIEKLNKIKNK